MNKDVLLTIGIPTYNGGKYIKETVESILSQLVHVNEDEIEILISDNASTDNTEEIVRGILEQYPRLISYYKNDKNIGYDKNVDRLFRLAKGKYVEILGDDDFLENGFLEKIEKVLLNTKVEVILLNVFFLNIDTEEITKLPFLKNEKIDDRDDFFLKTEWRTAAVSSLIIKKEYWNKVDIGKYFGTQWVHLGGIIEILSLEGTKAYIFSDKSIGVRVSNNRWEGNFGNKLKVGFLHLKVLEEMLNLNYKKRTFNNFVKLRYSKNLNDILGSRPKKFKEKIEVSKYMIRFFWKYPFFWLIHLPTLFLIDYILLIKNGKEINNANK